MSRNIKIGEKKTFDDWGLILTSQNIGVPAPKTNYVDIPYADGSLDLTQALTGEVSYSNRSGSFDFDLIKAPADRQSLINEITNYLHGRVFDLTLPDEPQYLYRSRLSVNSVKTSMILNKLVVSAVSEPYKLKLEDTVQNVVVTDVVQTITCSNERMRVVPKIKTDAEITIEFKDQTFTMNAGTHQLLGIVFTQGDNELKISGTVGAKVEIRYREGLL